MRFPLLPSASLKAERPLTANLRRGKFFHSGHVPCSTDVESHSRCVLAQITIGLAQVRGGILGGIAPDQDSVFGRYPTFSDPIVGGSAPSPALEADEAEYREQDQRRDGRDQQRQAAAQLVGEHQEHARLKRTGERRVPHYE